MCFKTHNKKILFGLFIVGTLLIQTACDRFLKAPDKDPSLAGNSETIVISLDEVSCLKSTPALLQKFFDDEGDQGLLDQGVGCIQASLKAFMKYTRGAQVNSYTPKELQYFFNKYLLKGNQISDDFRKEIVKLKMVAVGGNSEQVTRAELELFIQFLDVLKTEGGKLQGKMRLLFFRQEQPLVSYEQVQALQKIVQDVTGRILAKSKVTESRYQWVDLVSFMSELNHFVGESKSLAAVLKWVPLAESVKVLFVGDNAKLLTEREWSYSVRWMVDTYSIVLKFYYELQHQDLSTPPQWTTLIRWLDEVMTGIESSPAMKEKKVLDAVALDRLAAEIYKLKLFQTELSLDLVKTTYRKALVHMIDGLPGALGDAVNVPGLTEKHFRIFKQEYSAWKQNQMFIDELYRNNPVETTQTMTLAAAKVNAMEKAQALADGTMNQQELQRSWADFSGLLSSDHPIVYNARDKVVISYNPKIVPFSFTGANMMNFVYSITRLALRGYGEHKSANLFDNRMTETGLVQLEEDFRQFGQKIGLIDPRNSNAAKSTFKGGNLFTYHGNGDQWLTPVEIFEELNLMLSGGRTQIDQIMVDLEKRGCLMDKLDVFGKKIANEACFVQAFRENLKDYLDNLPWMRAFISTLSNDEFVIFYQNVMAASQLDPQFHINGRLEYTEIRNMGTILHYIESLMVVYDRDFNQKLSEEELVLAVPRFEMFIESVSPLRDYFVEDIFLYLVYKGEKPTGVKDLVAFKLERALGLGEATKLNLIKVLGVLKKDIK